MALKEEIEEIADQSKKVHSDHLLILKGITESMKKIKDRQSLLTETDFNRQESMVYLIDYLNMINKVLSSKPDDQGATSMQCTPFQSVNNFYTATNNSTLK